MKKSVALAVLLLFVKLAIGQGLAVTNAVIFYENNDLAKAKEQIDKAVLHEKTSTSAKAWYYRGMIYMDLASSDKQENKDLAKDGFKVAADAFEKVKQYDKPNGQYAKLLKDRSYPLWANSINKGFTIKDENPKEAYEYYDIAQKLYPDSIAAYEYAIDLAYKTQNYEKLKEYYAKIIEVNKNPTWYSNWAWVLSNIDKNDEKALEVIQKGRKEFPTNGKLMEDEINSFIALKRIDEAQAKMEQAIQTDTKNPLLYFNLGTIYAKKGNDVKSLELYNQALALDPNSFESNFNIGAHYYNKAAELITLTNKMSLTEYQKTGKKKEDEAFAYMRQALPYLEKSYQITPADADVKKILKDIYRRLKMTDKLESLNNK
jgi:tetratricopeptide (TPR) repeat protein